MAGDGQTVSVEAVRGRIDDDLAAELIAFWEANGALRGDAAKRRLPEVVCIARGPAGDIAGASSAYPEQVPTVGGRTFWIYRSFLAPSASAAADDMVRETFAALAEGFDPRSEDPIGLCLLLTDRREMERRPEAEWADPQMIYAGYLPDGRQIRIAYFEGAAIAPGEFGVRDGWELAPEYRIAPLAESGASEQDVLDLWAREGAVPHDEATRRLDEVRLVATHNGELVGVSSSFL